MRCFLAIKLSNQVIEDILKLQEEIKRYNIKGRWTNKNNFHITLKFFGEVSLDDIEKIKSAVEEIVADIEPFSIKINRIGCFKGKDNCRVLWVGISDDKDIILLHDVIDEKLLRIGFKRDDKKFKTHITIAREIKLSKDIYEINNIYKFSTESFSVSNIVLMESKIIDNKRLYIPIFTVPLKKDK